MTDLCTDMHFYVKGPRDYSSKTALILSLILQNVYFIPRRALRIHLAGMANILKHNAPALQVIDLIPKDPNTCISYFDLNPVVMKYLVCPTCNCLYPLDAPIRKMNCGYQSTPESSVCGEPLWRSQRTRGNVTRKIPLKVYTHHDLNSWLGRLFSRPNIEDMIDGRPHGSNLMHAEAVEDIWQSEVFLNLKDSSGQNFYPGPGSESRLIFSISVDSFNPFGNKTAKQIVSSTGIWLVLLNLPPMIRHLPENLYLAGIIPGPSKPSKEEINHYVQLVVDDLKRLWSPGVYLTRTFKYSMGRLLKGMVVPVVCDLLGAHQLVGYASSPTAHYMCPLCDLDKDDINIFHRHNFPKKNPADSKQFATLWKDAANEDHRKQIFDAFGWRWSPLFELPYFDPTLFTVVDTMHNIDIGLFQFHCREVFQ